MTNSQRAFSFIEVILALSVIGLIIWFTPMRQFFMPVPKSERPVVANKAEVAEFCKPSRYAKIPYPNCLWETEEECNSHVPTFIANCLSFQKERYGCVFNQIVQQAYVRPQNEKCTSELEGLKQKYPQEPAAH